MRAWLLFALLGCRIGFDTVERDAAIGGSSDSASGDAIGFDASDDGASVNCPTNYTILVGQSSRYLAIDNSITWLIGEQMCEADGTHLVIVDDNAERMAVASLLPGQNKWLGVTDRITVGTFRKVTGPMATYLPWDGSEPDATAPECVYMDSLTTNFVDQDCTSGRRPVCECDGVAVDPSSY